MTKGCRRLPMPVDFLVVVMFDWVAELRRLVWWCGGREGVEGGS